jgi:hypothetical protein
MQTSRYIEGPELSHLAASGARGAAGVGRGSCATRSLAEPYCSAPVSSCENEVSVKWRFATALAPAPLVIKAFSCKV